jgi:hypothetical protein
MRLKGAGCVVPPPSVIFSLREVAAYGGTQLYPHTLLTSTVIETSPNKGTGLARFSTLKTVETFCTTETRLGSTGCAENVFCDAGHEGSV